MIFKKEELIQRFCIKLSIFAMCKKISQFPFLHAISLSTFSFSFYMIEMLFLLFFKDAQLSTRIKNVKKKFLIKKRFVFLSWENAIKKGKHFEINLYSKQNFTIQHFLDNWWLYCLNFLYFNFFRKLKQWISFAHFGPKCRQITRKCCNTWFFTFKWAHHSFQS